MKTKRSQFLKCAVTVAAGVILVALGSSTGAYAQSANAILQAPDVDVTPASFQPERSGGPAGSWLYTVTIPGFTFQGLETYSDGGGYTEADQLSFLPIAVASAGHGAWKRTGKKTFLLKYVNLTFADFSSGTPTGTLKVRQTTTLDQTGNLYSGSGDYTYYDLDGNPIPSISGVFTITAKRITVEAPGKN